MDVVQKVKPLCKLFSNLFFNLDAIYIGKLSGYFSLVNSDMPKCNNNMRLF